MRNAALLAFALAIGVISSASAAADQFDLICTSKYHDATFHYRLDVAANKWCATAETKNIWGQHGGNTRCAPEGFSAIGSDVIVFDAYEPIDTVDRVTGEWHYKNGGEAYVGTCEAAPFSGFPELDTKF